MQMYISDVDHVLWYLTYNKVNVQYDTRHLYFQRNDIANLIVYHATLFQNPDCGYSNKQLNFATLDSFYLEIRRVNKGQPAVNRLGRILNTKN